MATSSTEIQLVISAQNEASKELQKLGNDLTGLKNKIDQQGKAGSSLAKGIASLAGSYLVLKKGIVDSVKAYIDEEAQIARINQAVSKTTQLTGVSAEHLVKYADEMQFVFNQTEDEIRSAQANLATFNNIHKEIFDQAIKSTMDFATATGQNAGDASVMLGRALQDPAGGLGRLNQRYKVLTPSMQKNIEDMAKQGKIAEAQALILDKVNNKWGGFSEAMGKTLQGRLAMVNKGVDELKEALGKGLVNGITVALGGIDTSTENFKNKINSMTKFISKWASTFVIALKWVGKMIYDAFNLVGVVLGSSLNAFITWAKEVWKALTHPLEAIKTLAGALKQLFSGDYEGAMNTASSVLQGTLQASTVAFEMSSEAIGKFSEDTNTALNELNSAWQKNEEITTASAGAGGGAMEDYGESAQDMAKKVEDAKKKISDLKKEMKEAVKEAKQAIKDLKKEYKEQEKEAQASLGKSIADVVVSKQEELRTAQEDYAKATTEEEKKVATDKMATIQTFLTNHKKEQDKYSKEINEAQRYAQMDEIQQLQYTFAQEQKERKKDYEEQLKDLKKHLKEVKKEYKEKISDLKKELQKELGNIKINIDISTDKEKKKKRAFGGSVMAGESYLVGENRPEVFVPSQSGNIKQMEQVGRNITVNFNNPVVRNDTDLQRIVAVVENTLSRKQELTSMGAI